MLVCGKLPFQDVNESEMLTKILDCKYIVPDYLSDHCKKLIINIKNNILILF